MPERIRKIAAGVGVLLGTAHLIYGWLTFKSLTPDHIWFAGAGIAMVCVGLSAWRAPARFEAAIMTAYLGVMATVMPLPQIFLGLAIFVTLSLPIGLKRKV